jgi:hypothetical protein
MTEQEVIILLKWRKVFRLLRACEEVIFSADDCTKEQQEIVLSMLMKIYDPKKITARQNCVLAELTALFPIGEEK